MIRQWSFNFPSSSSANARSIPQCSLESTTDLNPIICGQYFQFKTITSYSANELIIALMNKMNPKFNPNITYTDFNTNKYLFCSAVARYLPYGPTDFAQWNIVIGMPNDIYIFDKNHFNLDCKFLGASNEKITCDVLENEKAAIREARAQNFTFELSISKTLISIPIVNLGELLLQSQIFFVSKIAISFAYNSYLE